MTVIHLRIVGAMAPQIAPIADIVGRSGAATQRPDTRYSEKGEARVLADEVPDAARVAVYWDFENLLISQYKHVHGREAWEVDSFPTQLRRSREAPIDLDVVLRYAASLGTISVNRAYCDWTRPMFRSYGLVVAGAGGEPVQQFAATASKNGADIRIAVDIAEDLTSDETITDVVVCSGDSDFLALVEYVQRSGRRLHAVGVEGSTSGVWARSCDFHGYNELAALPADGAGRATATVEHLLGALERLPGGQWVPVDALPVLIRRGDGALDHNSVGTESLAALIAECIESGLVEQAGANSSLRIRSVSSDAAADVESPAAVGPAAPTEPIAPASPRNTGRWPRAEAAARRLAPHMASAAGRARNRLEAWWYQETR